MMMPKTTDDWIALIKSFGLPVAILGYAAWLLWQSTVEQDTFIRTKLLEMHGQTVKAVENSAAVTERCMELMERVEAKIE